MKVSYRCAQVQNMYSAPTHEHLEVKQVAFDSFSNLTRASNAECLCVRVCDACVCFFVCLFCVCLFVRSLARSCDAKLVLCVCLFVPIVCVLFNLFVWLVGWLVVCGWFVCFL